MVSSKSHSCLGCKYYSKDSCMWFVIKRNHRYPKLIPCKVIDTGCKYQLPVEGYNGKHKSIVSKLVELFNGEFIC